MQCVSCGNELNRTNMKGVSKRKYKAGIHPICLQCQQKKYDETKRYTENRMLRIYMCCFAFDTPFYPWIAEKLFAEGIDIADEWIQYLAKVHEFKKNKTSNGDFCAFEDGETSLDNIIQEMKENDDEEEASRKWGMIFDENGEEREYTEKELKELENIYKEQAAEYKGAITPRVDMSIREISICRLEWKKRVGMGDTQGAKRYMDMIKDAMA